MLAVLSLVNLAKLWRLAEPEASDTAFLNEGGGADVLFQSFKTLNERKPGLLVTAEYFDVLQNVYLEENHRYGNN